MGNKNSNQNVYPVDVKDTRVRNSHLDFINEYIEDHSAWVIKSVINKKQFSSLFIAEYKDEIHPDKK